MINPGKIKFHSNNMNTIRKSFFFYWFKKWMKGSGEKGYLKSDTHNISNIKPLEEKIKTLFFQV